MINMNAKKLLVVAALSISGASHALTLEQSRGMIYAQCAGVYMTLSSIAFDQNNTQEYQRASDLLAVASAKATDRIGDSRTTDIGEATVYRLLTLYRKNPTAGKAQINKERSQCREFFEKRTANLN